MRDPNLPIYVVLPLDDMYEYMNDLVNTIGFYEFPFTIKSFADFVEDVVSAILPSMIINGLSSANEKANIFVGYADSAKLVNDCLADINIQIRHLQLPIYPVAGFNYRFYITSDLNLNIHYEHSSTQTYIKETHTRADILACIDNGDYISEKLRREYGI